MAKKYYEKETPVAVITEHGEFRYYKEAKILQVSRPKWKTMDDEIRMGKTVSLNITGLKGNAELKEFFNMLVEELG